MKDFSSAISIHCVSRRRNKSHREQLFKSFNWFCLILICFYCELQSRCLHANFTSSSVLSIPNQVNCCFVVVNFLSLAPELSCTVVELPKVSSWIFARVFSCSYHNCENLFSFRSAIHHNSPSSSHFQQQWHQLWNLKASSSSCSTHSDDALLYFADGEQQMKIEGAAAEREKC